MKHVIRVTAGVASLCLLLARCAPAGSIHDGPGGPSAAANPDEGGDGVAWTAKRHGTFGPRKRDTKPPLITNERVAALASTSVRVCWGTSEPATTELLLGRPGSLASVARNTPLVVSHCANAGGLSPGVEYAFAPRSVDRAGNAAQAPEQRFTTPSAASSSSSSAAVSSSSAAVSSSSAAVSSSSGAVSSSSGAPSSSSSAGPEPAGQVWLHTQGNRILHADGSRFRGRGANIHDTRSCNACSWNQPNVGEVKRRIDELVDRWGANFMRLDLESYPSPYDSGQVQWRTFTEDPEYLADIVEIVAYVGTKPGVYVLVSLWIDPTISDLGWPTTATGAAWRTLVAALGSFPHAMFGLVNEPESNYDGAQDAACWQAMNNTVAAIRAEEDAIGVPHHIVTVQGTRAWARRLDYYLTHPVTAGNGENVAYETHVYDPVANFQELFIGPSATLPVIIGEFGPLSMTVQDCLQLMTEAQARDIPHLAWTFHMRCPPNLLVDNSAGGCGAGMTLAPTSWGTAFKNRLAQPW